MPPRKETPVYQFIKAENGLDATLISNDTDPYEPYRKPTDSALFACKLSPSWLESITNLDQSYDLISTQNYIAYLEKKEAAHIKQYGMFAHKAKIQLECKKLRINDEKTRIIDPQDLGTLIRYVEHLISQGRTVWIGSSTIDDMTDPQKGKEDSSTKSVTPPLYKKGINKIEDLYAILPSINIFKNQHPDMLLKVFPQDMEKPTLTSIVFADNEKERKISFHFRPGKYTPKGERDDSLDQPIDIEVDFNNDIPFIYINKVEDLQWLEIVLESEDIFTQIDKIDFGSSPLVNVELMHLDGHKTLDFVTDIIYGDGDKTTQFTPIKFVAMLKQIRSGIVSIKNSKFDPKEFIGNSSILATRVNELLESSQKRYREEVPTITEIATALANLSEHDYKLLVNLSSNYRPSSLSKSLVTKYLIDISVYLSADQYRIINKYLSYRGKTKKDLLEGSFVNFVHKCLTTKSNEDSLIVQHNKVIQNKVVAEYLLNLLGQIDLERSDFTIPPSILRTLSSLANSRITSESTTKAVLALRNRYSLSKRPVNDNRLYLKHSDKWNVIQ